MHLIPLDTIDLDHTYPIKATLVVFQVRNQDLSYAKTWLYIKRGPVHCCSFKCAVTVCSSRRFKSSDLRLTVGFWYFMHRVVYFKMETQCESFGVVLYYMYRCRHSIPNLHLHLQLSHHPLNKISECIKYLIISCRYCDLIQSQASLSLSLCNRFKSLHI